jgi:hypothetical protein
VQFEHLKRRDFITLLGDSAALPPVACAQHLPGKLPTIGLLGPATPAARGPSITALVPQRPISKKGALAGFWVDHNRRQSRKLARCDDFRCAYVADI